MTTETPLASHRRTRTPAATLLIRIMVGGIFCAEGIQKFVYPDAVGAGRFVRIGIPWPEVLGPLVGGFEVLCGALVLAGLCTRLAVLPLLGIMLVALLTTKLPILLGQPIGPFALRSVPYHGVLGFLHESRTDLCMTLGSLYLLLMGAGTWSLDGRRTAVRA